MPPRASVEIENYLQRVQRDVEGLALSPFIPNMSRSHMRAVRELANNADMVIKSADKGSGIVVENRDSYIRDGLAHLGDPAVYAKIDRDPTKALGRAINEDVY